MQQVLLNRPLTLCLTALLLATAAGLATPASADDRPNILFAMADDWGYPHAGVYGDPVVQTPTFDRLAREGVLFEQAYVSSPSCTPSRGAILTGQYHWRLKGAGNLWSVFPDEFATYPEILAESGYETGSTGKAWGPGRPETAGRPLGGERFNNFRQFLSNRDDGKPFCFWLGSSDPHRPYKLGSGEESGMDLSAINLPAAFPDSPVTRGDVADYYWEVQRFDGLVGDAVAALEEGGLLENTIILMTGDHGMPFPRGKSNCYDLGMRVPLAVRWPGRGKPGRTVTDFVSLTDLAPTYYEVAGLEIPDDVTGRSLVPILNSDAAGRVDRGRTHVIFGKERHVPSQEAPDMGGYPTRGIRTYEFLYLRNFRPDRWPDGTPYYENAAMPGNWLADTDNGPTKTYIVEHKDDDAEHARFWELSFGMRPAEELYDLSKDPDQLVNVADDPAYADVKAGLHRQLVEELQATADPRALGNGEFFDAFEYLGGGPKHPDWERPRRNR